ncbi:DUF2971 domain-containing protein [Piscinibacterium candidicorallinum]|uniref:DUF2971 domain-containing protein n=1 Tax=Piscinibacterium candidicorallinum TaxID=1793872 RepID=UPI003671FF51
MRVYRFLDEEYAIRSIQERRLKVSRLDDLNDPFEFQVALDRSSAESIAITETLKNLSDQWGVLCFSRGWGNPVIWSHYARKHYGIALGFEIPDDGPMTVTYANALPAPRFTRRDERTEIDTQSIQEILATKFAHWHYEQEVRAWYELESCTREGDYYFKTFSAELNLREVILGARCAVAEADERLRLLASSVTVRRAALSHDRYEMK